MKKICVVLTARTSYAKIKSILHALEKHPNLELQLVCAASAVLEKYGNTDKMVESDGFHINEKIFMIVEGDGLVSSAKSVGLGIIEFASAFDRLKPDAVLVMADRYEILAPAIAASYQNIPLIHVQGGEVSGNIDEKVRHAVTKLADLHFPATQKARERIINMGENSENVHWVGCPSIDIANKVLSNPELDFDIYKRYGGVGAFPNLDSGYFIVMQHPVTTEYSEGLEQIKQTLIAVSELSMPVLWFWPNIDAGGDFLTKGIRSYRENMSPKNIHFLKNMEPSDFLRVLNRSNGIIGNSSAAIREASFLGVPAINVGSRQNARERGGNVVDVPYDKDAIKNAIEIHCLNKLPSSNLYGQGRAAESIVKHIANTELTFKKSLLL